MEEPPITGNEKAIIDPEVLEALQEAERLTEKALVQLKKEIKNHEYGVVLGEDASGRIPALIVAGVLKKIAERDGVKAPLIRFTPGVSGLVDTGSRRLLDRKREHLEDYIGNTVRLDMKKAGLPGERVLFVTDTIKAGRSTKFFKKIFDSLGLSVDFLTLGGAPDLQVRRELGERVVSGGEETPRIYGWHRLSGVFKGPEGLFSKPHRWRFDYPESLRQSDPDQAKFLDAELVRFKSYLPDSRKFVREAAERIARDFLG